MIAYEFYWQDEKRNSHLLAILPERRRNAARINHESIMNWVKKIIGNQEKIKNVYYIKVNVN